MDYPKGIGQIVIPPPSYPTASLKGPQRSRKWQTCELYAI